MESLQNGLQGRIQTFVQEGAPTLTRGRLPNTLIKFSRKPYEIKEILVHRGRAPGAPPPLRSATGLQPQSGTTLFACIVFNETKMDPHTNTFVLFVIYENLSLCTFDVTKGESKIVFSEKNMKR